MKCAACSDRVKFWKGDDPKCAFRTGVFSSDNWNCATVGMIRDLVYEGQSPMPPDVDYRYCEDMKYATIKIDHLPIHWMDTSEPMALWVAWYKSRGRTDAIWLLFSDQPPRAPTAAECTAIAEAVAEAMRK